MSFPPSLNYRKNYGQNTTKTTINIAQKWRLILCSCFLDLEQALRMPVDLVDFDFQKDFFELLQRVGELKQIG